MNYTIREARLEDLDQIFGIWYSYKPSSYDKLNGNAGKYLFQQSFSEYYFDLIQKEKLYVAVIESKVIGWLLFKVNHDRTLPKNFDAEACSFVDKAYCNLGISYKLLNHACQKTVKSNCLTNYGRVSGQNFAVIRIGKHIGWQFMDKNYDLPNKTRKNYLVYLYVVFID